MSNHVDVCRKDIPYPSVSNESVPSLIDNLTTALYGATIQKTVVNGRVAWYIPCDPNLGATILGITRNPGEGLMCYFIRALSEGTVSVPGGQAGQIVYQTAPSVTGFVQTGNVGQVLFSGGTSSPYWSDLLDPIAAALIFG
jgi:hypothetical protein